MVDTVDLKFIFERSIGSSPIMSIPLMGAQIGKQIYIYFMKFKRFLILIFQIVDFLIDIMCLFFKLIWLCKLKIFKFFKLHIINLLILTLFSLGFLFGYVFLKGSLSTSFNLCFYLCHIYILYIVIFRCRNSFLTMTSKLSLYYIFFFIFSLFGIFNASNIIHLSGELIKDAAGNNPSIPICIFMAFVLYPVIHPIIRDFKLFYRVKFEEDLKNTGRVPDIETMSYEEYLILDNYNLRREVKNLYAFYHKKGVDHEERLLQDNADLHKALKLKNDTIYDLKQELLDTQVKNVTLNLHIDGLNKTIQNQSLIIKKLFILKSELIKRLSFVYDFIKLKLFGLRETSKDLNKINLDLIELKNQILNSIKQDGTVVKLPGNIIDKLDIPQNLTKSELQIFGAYIISNLKSTNFNELWCNFFFRFLNTYYPDLCGFSFLELERLIVDSKYNFNNFLNILFEKELGNQVEIASVLETKPELGSKTVTQIQSQIQPQPQLVRLPGQSFYQPPYRVYLSELPTVYPGPQAHLEALAREHSHIVVYPGPRGLVDNVDSGTEVKQLPSSESETK